MTSPEIWDENDAVVIGSDDVKEYNEDNVLPLPADTQDLIHGWLEPTPYDAGNGEYRKHLSSHLKGTGDWLLDSAPFCQWRNSDDEGILWIKGIPGSGKSVIASTLVESLAAEGAPVLYFFFRQIIDANHAPIALLRDWLDQILAYSPPLQVRLHDYIEDRRELKSFSIHNLWEELKVAIASLTRVYFIVDALDEMDRGNDLFLQQLAKLGSLDPSRFKVIITSRPVASVEMPLRQTSILQIRLEDEHVDRDITTYVASRLSGSSVPSSQHTMIKQAVPGRANGLFLYAKLAMDAFLKEGADVQEVMKLLPMDLNAIYERLLHEHAERSQVPHRLQLHILAWVTHAARPLRLLEIAEMIKVSQKALGLTDLKAIKELVRTACGPLLEILPDETVCVIHHSFTEFLNGSTRCPGSSVSSSGYPVLDMGSTNSLLAQDCISYILQSGCLEAVGLPKKEDLGSNGWLSPSFPTDDAIAILSANKALFSVHSFLTYAVDNWHYHLKKAEDHAENMEGGISQGVFGGVAELLSETNLPKLDMLIYRSHTGTTPIHTTSRWGLSKCLDTFLQQNKFDINLKDEAGNTAMLLAAASGHEAAVKVLLANGANPDVASENDGHKALHKAAQNNHAGVVTLLLAAGVDPLTPKTKESPGRSCGNAPRTEGHTPLMYAASGSNKEVVAAFMPYLKCSDVVNKALSWAANGGNSDAVRVILEHPLCQVNERVSGNTALFTALLSQKLKAAIALLEGGADPSILSGKMGRDGRWIEHYAVPPTPGPKGQDGYNALQALCGAPRPHSRSRTFDRLKDIPAKPIEQCVSLMVKAGVDVNAKDEDGNPPLRYASEHSPFLVQQLLEAGADANIEGRDGTTCLHAAKNPETVQLLVKMGNANIDKKRISDGKTPFLAAFSNASLDSAKQFWELGADPNVTDADGSGALHLYLHDQTKIRREADLDVIKILLQAGVSPDSRDHEGRTPLHLLSYTKIHQEVLAMLIAAGADPNARDNKGQTPIFNIAATGHYDAVKILEVLKNAGAQMNILDHQGRNVMFTYLARRSPEMRFIEELIRLGVDPGICDFQGNTLWHLIFENKPIGVFGEKKPHIEALKQLGVDATAINHTGQSALHMFVGQGFSFLTDMLELFKSSIDLKDHNGIRPLHIAARVSEQHVVTLLAAGASPSEPTYEGMTPLHVAARFRQSDIVGLLLEELQKKFDKTQMLSYLNIPYKSRAPLALQIACRSGMPETVSLLLAAGADPNPAPLTWCLQYETEQALWNAPQPSPGGSYGVLIDDSQRLTSYHSTNVVGRLEEVFDVLRAHGADFTVSTERSDQSDLEREISRRADTGLKYNRDYTTICLLKLRKSLSGPQSQLESLGTDSAALDDEAYVTSTYDGTKIPSHPLLVSIRRRAACLGAFKETDEPRQTREKQRALKELIADHQWETCKYWLENKPSHFEAFYNGESNISTLIHYGLSSLVADVLTKEISQQWEGSYKAFQPTGKHFMVPPLLTACGRRLSSLALLQCLIERSGLNVNLQQRSEATENAGRVIKLGLSPLHILASGQCWWQVAQGLPYILSQGADMELRVDSTGRTPLLEALASSGLHAKRAARFLIDAGANVNAVDNDGKSCLTLAGVDQAMIKLLVERGAEVTAWALFSVIEKGNADLLDFFLERESPDIRKPGDKSEMEKRGGVDSHQMYPLYYAAKTSPEEYMDSLWRRDADPATIKQGFSGRHLPCIETLVKRGANLFAKYDKWVRVNEDSWESKYIKEEQTLLHDLLEEGGLVGPILELGELDLEHRDAQGRTLLLAACRSRLGPDSSIDAAKFKAGIKEYSIDNIHTDKPSLVDFFLERGSCATVQDNDGKNALHHLLHRKPRGGLDSLRRLVSHAPELTHHIDLAGDSPLHYALRRYDTFGGPDTEAIEILMEAGADIHAPDAQGNIALHHLGTWLAEHSDRKEDPAYIRHLFRRLVSGGLPINARNHRGETPFFSFISSQGTYRGRANCGGEEERQLAALNMLLELGADVLTTNDEGDTLLHVVASSDSDFYGDEGEVEMIQRFRWLLDQGLDLLRENAKNQTCLDVAAQMENEPILKLYQRKA